SFANGASRVWYLATSEDPATGSAIEAALQRTLAPSTIQLDEAGRHRLGYPVARLFERSPSATRPSPTLAPAWASHPPLPPAPPGAWPPGGGQAGTCPPPRTPPPPTPNAALSAGGEDPARLCQPARIHWVDGSDAEHALLLEEMLTEGTLLRLNGHHYPDCFLHRSDPSDVARTEHLTFICTSAKDDAGPSNNCMEPAEAKRKVGALFEGAMRGRTMYVIPYVMGPLGSSLSKVGVEITDSPYVVANMRIMTRMGAAALKQLGPDGTFVKGLHSLG